MVTVSLTKEQWGVVLQVLNAVNGLENARIILPIFDAVRSALNPPAAEIQFEEQDEAPSE